MHDVERTYRQGDATLQILSGADAREKVDAGASLVQLYTGLIYRGPALVAECAAAMRPR